MRGLDPRRDWRHPARSPARVRRLALSRAVYRKYGITVERARSSGGDAHAAPPHIAEAKATLRDPQRFYDAAAYADAVETIEAATRLISAAHAPLHLDFSAYRTPFSLTTPEEIRRDATPERDPFDDYLHSSLLVMPRADPAKTDRWRDKQVP